MLEAARLLVDAGAGVAALHRVRLRSQIPGIPTARLVESTRPVVEKWAGFAQPFRAVSPMTADRKPGRRPPPNAEELLDGLDLSDLAEEDRARLLERLQARLESSDDGLGYVPADRIDGWIARSFSERLREARLDAGYKTQAALGSLIGDDEGKKINRYEHADKNWGRLPGAIDRARLARHLHVELTWFWPELELDDRPWEKRPRS
jgi:hypothetical protein